MSEALASLEDRLEAVTTLPPLVQQISAMEADLRKLAPLATVISSGPKIDIDGFKAALLAVKPICREYGNCRPRCSNRGL